MAKEFYVISDDEWDKQAEAVKEFTDREDPQEAFERKVKVLKETWKDGAYYILNYYGIGGIGKTSFVNKLCRVIRGVEGNRCRLLGNIDCEYIRYDFDAKNVGMDKLSILLNFRKQLTEVNKEFKFYRFDSAVLLYAKKTGNDFTKDETAQSMLESNPWLEVIVSTIGIIPVVGWVSGVVQAIDKSFALAKEGLMKHIDSDKYQKHLHEINGLEAPEILDKLHEYFILDMRHNMRQVAEKPLIIFLDSYEKYVDTLNYEIDMLTEDYWLWKGKRSVVCAIPGILWVITGREKLCWKNSIWGELDSERPLDQMSDAEKDTLAQTCLEQHLLGDLSKKDAITFLRKAGIHNEKLCVELHELTKGTPLFLDICVDTYYELLGAGIQPSIEDFGEDLSQLISRYLSNMSESNREMAYFLACLGTWDNDSVKEIAKEAVSLRWYSFAKYEEFIKHSFIIKKQNGTYCMHDTMRKATLESADKEILREISHIKCEKLEVMMKNDNSLDSNFRLVEYVRNLAGTSYAYDEIYKKIRELKEKFYLVSKEGKYDLLCSTTKELLSIVVKKYPASGIEYIARSEYGEALRLYGLPKKAMEVVQDVPIAYSDIRIKEMDWNYMQEIIADIYFDNGMYKEACAIEEQVLEKRVEYNGVESMGALFAKSRLVSCYYEMGNRKKAVELAEQLLDEKTRNLGEMHNSTLATIQKLAGYYSESGDRYKAHKMFEKVFEARTKTLGMEHLGTATAMLNLAISFSVIEDTRKAIDLSEKVLSLRTKILGKEHPDTLFALNAVSTFYQDMGDTKKACELKEQVLEVRKKVLGEEHPDTLLTKNNLAISYQRAGDTWKAMELAGQALEGRIKVLGEEHPYTLRTKGNLASLYEAKGDIKKAVCLREQVLEVQMRVLGEEHPDTLHTKHRLANLYTKLNDM